MAYRLSLCSQSYYIAPSLTRHMDSGPRADIKTLIVDPETFIQELSDEKVRLLLMELEMLMEEYERENTIMYLACNYSSNKHLGFSARRAMHVHEIREFQGITMKKLLEEIC